MTASTWAPVPEGSPFGVENLPYGVFSTEGAPPRIGVRIGDSVLDVAAIPASPEAEAFRAPALNELMSRGPEVCSAVRGWLTRLLTDPVDDLVDLGLLERATASDLPGGRE